MTLRVNPQPVMTNYTQPRFGNAGAARVAGEAAEALFKTPVPSRVLRTFDFQQLGDTALKQVQLIYGACIASRILAASKRSGNEVFETVTRDPLGWVSWFYAMPMLQRAFLKHVAPEKYRDGLIAMKAKPTGEGVMAGLKKLNYALNPLSKYDIATRGQIQDRKAQFLEKLVQKGEQEGSEAFTKASKYFDGVLKWRNYATGLGIALTILLLGVGIKYVNIAVTKARMAATGDSNNPQQP